MAAAVITDMWAANGEKPGNDIAWSAENLRNVFNIMAA
jgi:hypothetical protein